MTDREILGNVIDELERAIHRIKEIGEFKEDSITPDEELVTDMTTSIDRLYDMKWEMNL